MVRIRVLTRAVLLLRRRTARHVCQRREPVPDDGATASGGDKQRENVPVSTDDRRTFLVEKREKNREFQNLIANYCIALPTIPILLLYYIILNTVYPFFVVFFFLQISIQIF